MVSALAHCLWRGEIRTGGAITHWKISSGCAASESVSASGASRRARDSPRIAYTSRSDATPEVQISALASIYRLVLDHHAKKMAAEPAPEPASCNDAAIVRNTEEASHVEQRLDRPSETTYPAAFEFAKRTRTIRRHNSLLERGQ